VYTTFVYAFCQYLEAILV